MAARSASEAHERWLKWRERVVTANFPDVCLCYLRKPYARQGSCKNCEMCPGCNQHIKVECWSAHVDECRALRDRGANLEAEKSIVIERMKRKGR